MAYSSTKADAARSYATIGSIATLIIGLIIIIIGLVSPVAPIPFIVFGFLSLICAITSYTTVSEKIRTGDIEGAKRWCLIYGVLLLIVAFVIGGIFFLLAHSQLSGERVIEIERPWESEKERRRGRIPEPRKTKELLDETAGYLEPLSGPDLGQPAFPINNIHAKIGRGEYGKDESEGVQNDLQLSESDESQSRNQARLRVDPDTLRVYLMHDSKTSSQTIVAGQMCPYGKEMELRDGVEIEFGTKGSSWRFRRSARALKSSSAKRTQD